MQATSSCSRRDTRRLRKLVVQFAVATRNLQLLEASAATTQGVCWLVQCDEATRVAVRRC
jgi:hypothetical protein